ncbi:MAG: hypothetical protein ACKVXR_05795 [Planctomycetota bacterium]
MSRRRTVGSSLPFPREAVGSPARFVGGIDEAGLGPLLGPLTIGFAVFRVPDPDVDLWSALETAVARTPEECDGNRIAVADSKVLFDRTPRGEARLETCALAFLALAAATRRAPSSGIELLHRIPAALRGSGRLLEERWIAFLPDRLPLFVSVERLERAVEMLEEAARARQVEIVAAGTRIVPVAELNASLERTDNKSRTHWDLSAGILRLLWDDHAPEGLDLLVDRHGGRMRYGPLLRETFPHATVTTVDEEGSRSEYRVTESGSSGARWMRIVFAERAESASLPVALASCLAKHARETCMRGFNSYFLSLQPGLRATAGYVNDGRRWLAEARSALAAAGLRDSELLRAR